MRYWFHATRTQGDCPGWDDAWYAAGVSWGEEPRASMCNLAFGDSMTFVVSVHDPERFAWLLAPAFVVTILGTNDAPGA